MSSRSGLVGISGAAAYASSKAAIRNHSKSVALYCAQQGWRIRCNSIHPAAILTPMWEALIGNGHSVLSAVEWLIEQKEIKSSERTKAYRALLALHNRHTQAAE